MYVVVLCAIVWCKRTRCKYSMQTNWMNALFYVFYGKYMYVVLCAIVWCKRTRCKYGMQTNWMNEYVNTK
jgi:hypothetical protein